MGDKAEGERAMSNPADAVVIVRNGHGGSGSGTFLAPDLILTAAHCVYSSTPGSTGLMLPIRVSLDGNQTFVDATVIGYNPVSDDGSSSPSQSAIDFALIRLTYPYPTRPTMGFSVDWPGGSATSTGWPGNATARQSVTSIVQIMPGFEGLPRRVYSMAYVEGGMSGGALWRMEDGRAVIVGVNASHNVAANYAMAGQLTLETMQQIEDWLAIIGRSPAIARLYRTLLGREPNTSGLVYWSDRIVQYGRDVVFNQIVQAFIGSPEYQADYAGQPAGAQIATVYARALDRLPDAEGLAYWLSIPLDWAFVGITQSAEAMSYGSRFPI